MSPDPKRIAAKLRDVADRLELTGQQFLDETREDHRGFGTGSTVHVAGGDHSDPTWEAVKLYGPDMARERRQAVREMQDLYRISSDLSARLHRVIPKTFERCSRCDKRIEGTIRRWEGLPVCGADYQAALRASQRETGAA